MPKRILQGPVVSDKGDKTVVVRIDRMFTHPLLKKTVRRSKRYQAHDESEPVQGRRPRSHPGMCVQSRKPRRWEVIGTGNKG